MVLLLADHEKIASRQLRRSVMKGNGVLACIRLLASSRLRELQPNHLTSREVQLEGRV